MYMLHWIVCGSTSLYIYFVAVHNLKYMLEAQLWCNVTGVTGYHVG